MTARAANDFTLLMADRRKTENFRVENAEVLYIGSLCGLDAGGYLDAWEDEASMKWMGVFEGWEPAVVPSGSTAGTPTAAGDTSVTPIISGKVDISGKKLIGVDVTGVTAITDLNSFVYSTTDHDEDLTLTPTTNVRAIGWLSAFRSVSDMDVYLFTPHEYLQFNNFGDAIAALTNNIGGSANGTIGDCSAPVTLTNSTGASGIDTVADGLTAAATGAVTGATLAGTLTGTANGTLEDIADIALSTGDSYTDSAVNTAVNAAILAANLQIKELLEAVNKNVADLVSVYTQNATFVTDITAQNTNDSSITEKVIELVTLAGVQQDALEELAIKQEEIRAQLAL